MKPVSLLPILGAAVLLVAAPAAARQTPPSFADVADTSASWPDGERVLVVSAVMPASRAEVWAALTTEAGWKTYMGVAQARVDLRPGGAIETSYKPASEIALGSRGTIINAIEAVVPESLLIIRNTQAPVDFQHAEEFSRTLSIIALEPVDGGTRVTLRGTGFVAGAAYDSLYARFRMGNAYTLQHMHDAFAAR